MLCPCKEEVVNGILGRSPVTTSSLPTSLGQGSLPLGFCVLLAGGFGPFFIAYVLFHNLLN